MQQPLLVSPVKDKYGRGRYLPNVVRNMIHLLETLMEEQSVFMTAAIKDMEYVRYQVINEKIRHHSENVS